MYRNKNCVTLTFQTFHPCYSRDTMEKIDRIRWRDEEESRRPGLVRARSTDTDSLAIRAVSRRRSVDPAITLPIQYRTV